MLRLIQWLRILAVALFILVQPSLIPTYTAQAQEPIQNVVPKAGLPGSEFAFYAVGFDGNEKVAYWFNGPDGQVVGDEEEYVVYAYDQRADWTWVSPGDAPLGYWTAVARGMDSDVERIIPFYIGDPEHMEAVPGAPAPAEQEPAASCSPCDVPQATPDYGVEPEWGYHGEQFAFYSTGFGSQEKVAYWFHAPNGTTYGDETRQEVSSETGYVDWFWTAPDDPPRGVWTAVATGLESGFVRKITFEIRDPYAPQSGEEAGPASGASGSGDETELQPSSSLPPNPPEVAVDPLVNAPGYRFAFYATGYPPRETVYYRAVDPDGQIYEAGSYESISNEDGRADWSWRVPTEAPVGIWQMHVVGESSPLEYTIYFEVRDPNEFVTVTQTDIAVDPASGQPGNRFAFFATGFPPGETVRYWAVGPEGEVYSKGKYEVVSNEEGRADWTWRTPDDAKLGTWTMYAEGDKSLIRKVITFDLY